MSAAKPVPIPLGTGIYESRRPKVWGAIITTYSLAVTAVALRFTSRHLAKAKIGLDDWLIVTSLVRILVLSSYILGF